MKKVHTRSRAPRLGPALVLAGAIAIAGALAGCADRASQAFVPDPGAYPGAVLWFSADHVQAWRSGDSVSLGQEAFALPPFVLRHADGTLSRGPGKVGQSACVAAGQAVAFEPQTPVDARPLGPMDLNQLSIAFWVRPAALGDAPARLQSLELPGTASLEVWASAAGTEVRLQGPGTGAPATLRGAALPAGVWSHVVVTVNAEHTAAARRGLALYVDGASHGAVAMQPLPAGRPTMAFHAPAARGSGSGTATCFDEVLVFLDPLAPQTVQHLHTLGMGQGDPQRVARLRATAAAREDERQRHEDDSHFEAAWLRSLPASQRDHHHGH